MELSQKSLLKVKPSERPIKTYQRPNKAVLSERKEAKQQPAIDLVSITPTKIEVLLISSILLEFSSYFLSKHLDQIWQS